LGNSPFRSNTSFPFFVPRLSIFLDHTPVDKNSLFDRGSIGEMGLCVKKNKSQCMGVLGYPVARGIVRDARAAKWPFIQWLYALTMISGELAPTSRLLPLPSPHTPNEAGDCDEKVKETIKGLTERTISCRITPCNLLISIGKTEYVTYI